MIIIRVILRVIETNGDSKSSKLEMHNRSGIVGIRIQCRRDNSSHNQRNMKEQLLGEKENQKILIKNIISQIQGWTNNSASTSTCGVKRCYGRVGEERMLS
jgi:hypothetical protein